MLQVLLYLLLSAVNLSGPAPELFEDPSGIHGEQRTRIVGVLRALSASDTAPTDQLVLELRPLAANQLAFFFNILATRLVPGIEEDPQDLSELQHSFILDVLGGLDSSRTWRFFSTLPATPTRAAGAARIDILGVTGERTEIAEILRIARDVWLRERADTPEPPTLTRVERTALRRAITSILQRDESSIPALMHRWRGLHEEIKPAVLFALGSSNNPLALDALETILRGDGAWTSFALTQIRQLGKHHLASRNVELRNTIRQFLHREPRLASNACMALGTLEATESIDDLIELLGHQHPQVQSGAHWALKFLSNRAYPVDVGRWEIWHSMEKRWMALEKDDTFAKLHSGNPRVATRAATILGMHPLVFDELEESVERLLQSPDPEILVIGIHLAAKRKLAWSLPKLLSLFLDPNPMIGEAALDAARQLSGLGALPGSPAWDDYMLRHSFTAKGRG